MSEHSFKLLSLFIYLVSKEAPIYNGKCTADGSIVQTSQAHVLWPWGLPFPDLSLSSLTWKGALLLVSEDSWRKYKGVTDKGVPCEWGSCIKDRHCYSTRWCLKQNRSVGRMNKKLHVLLRIAGLVGILRSSPVSPELWRLRSSEIDRQAEDSLDSCS